MISEVIPLKNRLRDKRGSFSFSTFYPKIVINPEDHIENETYFWLGRDIRRYEMDYDRMKMIERWGNKTAEYLILIGHNYAPDQLFRKRSYKPPTYILSVRVYDANGNMTHHYFPIPVCNFMYDNTPYYDATITPVEQAYVMELENLNEHPGWNELGHLIAPVAHSSKALGYITSANDDDEIDKFFDIDRDLMDVWWCGNNVFLPEVKSSITDHLKDNVTTDIEMTKAASLGGIEDTEPLRGMVSPTCKFRTDIPLKADFPLTEDVLVGYENNDRADVFHGLNKEIEEFPFTEWAYCCNAVKQAWTLACYNAYSKDQRTIVYRSGENTMPPELAKKMESINCYLFSIGEMVLRRDCPLVEVRVYRSFNDDAYITYMYQDGAIKRFYLDFVLMVMGARSLLDDYECSWLSSRWL